MFIVKKHTLRLGKPFLLWVVQCKPRQGHILDCMQQIRAQFKYCLRQCKSNKIMARAERMAKIFINKDPKELLKEIKKGNVTGTYKCEQIATQCL